MNPPRDLLARRRRAASVLVELIAGSQGFIGMRIRQEGDTEPRHPREPKVAE
jgi:hypothetical protein